MAFPDVLVKADLTTPALQIPTVWTDWSDRLRDGLEIHQGRQRTLSRTEVGSMTAPLDNRDRGLDPTVNTSLRPLNHVKVEASWNGSVYPLFRGFVRHYPQEWVQDADAISTIEAEDGFSLMARYEFESQAIIEELAGAHIADVLSAFGWPTAGTIPPGSNWWQLGHTGSKLGTNTFLGGDSQSIDAGRSTIQALNATGNMLEHLLNVAENTDRGTLYMGPSGDVVFKQKPSAHAPVIGTWGPQPGEQRYVDFTVDFDDQQWFNDVRVTRRGDSTTYLAQDPARLNDGPRTLEVSDTLFSTTSAAQNVADELLATFDEPAVYPVRLVMRPKPDSSIWSLILGLPLMSKIRVRHRPALGSSWGDSWGGSWGAGPTIELDCYVIGITYNISQFWEITWDLAVAETLLNAWYLGTAGSTELGTKTVLA